MMARTLAGYRRTTLTALTLSLLIGLSSPAFGAFYRITEFADDNVVNGNCTLREAIRAANLNAAVDECSAGSSTSRDTIYLQAGTYTLDLLNGSDEDNAVNGDLDIRGDLLIVGVSPTYTVITRASVQSDERIFDIPAVSNVTFRNFSIVGGTEFDNEGGNLRIAAGASLDATEVVIGGGIAVRGAGIKNNGTLLLKRSIVRDNQTRDGVANGRGGGIENFGTLTMLDSEVRDNQADDHGGGIAHIDGALVIYRSQISGNTAGADGGGLFTQSDCDVQYSLLDANQAGRGGGFFVNAPQCELTQSAIVNNTAATDGGGLYAAQDTFVRRVTLAGNSAQRGGGVFSNTGMTLLDTTTIARNLGGGGLFNMQGINVEVLLMADNAGGNCLGAAPSAGAYNLDDANTCGFINDPANDQPNFPNTDPLLGALGEHGGPTPTIELLPGSPAIDAVSSLIQAGCQNAFDQRGRPRGRPRTALPVEEFHCDIGAYEFVAPYVVDTTEDRPDADPTDDLCMTTAGECPLRAAIMQANATPGTEEIVLPAGTFLLDLTGANEDAAASGDLDILDPVVLRGAGKADTIIDGAGQDRILDVFESSAELPQPWRTDIEDLTVTGGVVAGEDGGGIQSSSSLRLARVGVIDNEALAPDGDGAGVYCLSDCWLEIFDSEIAGNLSTGNGGGIFQNSTGAAVIERSALHNNTAGLGGGGEAVNLRLRNSTVSSNMTGSSGGFFAGQAIIEDSTIVNNQASSDVGGLFLLDQSIIRNTILAGNTEQGIPATCPSGANAQGIESLGHNLSDNSSADCSLNQATDQVNTQPLLGALGDNGGPSPTHALLSGSPAIDSGDDARCPATDQRGVARPQDGDQDLAIGCDIGAYELGDTDGDGVFDNEDNCLLVANGSQLDTDGDGFGNLCDGDFNNDCDTNVVDLGILRANFFAAGDLVTDMNGDGVTNVVDLGLLRLVFFTKPGPSGVAEPCLGL